MSATKTVTRYMCVRREPTRVGATPSAAVLFLSPAALRNYAGKVHALKGESAAQGWKRAKKMGLGIATVTWKVKAS